MGENEDVPLPKTVGILYNVKDTNSSEVRDEQAEYDSIDTVYAIRDAIELSGYKTVLLEENNELPEKLKNAKIDIVFNIAEGAKGRGREAQGPAILNLFNIPFTGSDETALCIALDKALCKRLLSTAGVKTPRFAVVDSVEEISSIKLDFPVIVKPNAEGSSKGIPDACIAADMDELKDLIKKNLSIYKESMLIEEYIDGREFTVGILGNGKDTKVYTPMEIAFRKNTIDKYKVYSFDVKQNYKEFIDYYCPSDILSLEDEEKMKNMALCAFKVLSCNDFARVDFRQSRSGEIYFIEINPLPGLAPSYSDYPMLMEFCGVPYNKLILSVLVAALRRLKMEAKGQ